MREQMLSSAAHRLLGQPMFQILNKIKEVERLGTDVVHFEIGDPDFATPKCIVDSVKKALDEGWTHYSPSYGDFDLRMEICRSRFFSEGFEPKLGQVVITPGANPLIYYIVRCVCEVGDEVIIPDPGFSTYHSVLEFVGVNTVPVPLLEENNFQMMAEDIAKKITDKTKLIIINSPHNPTGAVISPDVLHAIGELCLEKGIYLYCDEIYSCLNYSDTPYYSPALMDKCKERIIIANGFSKAFAMTGWRLGVGIGPEELMEKVALLVETTNSCVPTFVQRAAISAIREGRPDVIHMRDVYKARRDYLVERLNAIPGISCQCPGGAFYVFPNISGITADDVSLSNRILEEANVGLCPGTYFGKFGKGYVRLCYATSLERIKIGLDRIEAFVKRM